MISNGKVAKDKELLAAETALAPTPTAKTHTFRPFCNLAIVPARGIGDGLLMLTLAECFSKNGFQVTVYHSGVASLAPLFPSFQIKPLPSEELLESSLLQHDEVLFDQTSRVGIAFEDGRFDVRTHPFISFSTTAARPLLYRHHKTRIREKYPKERAERIVPLSYLNRLLRDPLRRNASIVENYSFIAEKILRFQNFSKTLPLHQKRALIPHPKRVVIHPESSAALKNWTPEKFIEVARILRTGGYDPIITVAPEQRERWQSLCKNEFEVPLFPSLLELYQFYSESAFFLGVDSGNGHLASAIGLPTVTIINRRKPRYRWRPDFGPGLILYPLLSKRLVGSSWPRFLSAQTVAEKSLQFFQKHKN